MIHQKESPQKTIRQGVGLLGGLLLLVLTLFAAVWAAGPALSKDLLRALQASNESHVQFQKHTLETGVVYLAIVPPEFTVLPVLSDRLRTIDRFEAPPGKSFKLMINAGYFDPNNHKTASYVTLDGQTAADPTQNERLVDNPSLKPYLPRIFNRTEFRVYACGGDGRARYDIARHQDAPPEGCTLKHAVGAGPELLPEDRSLAEAVIDVNARGALTRDPFGVRNANARSAVGITERGAVLLMMVAQDPKRKARGVSFAQLASLLKSAGAVKAMALDGGSSSAIRLVTGTDGTETVLWGKYDAQGAPVKRPIKSVLVVLTP